LSDGEDSRKVDNDEEIWDVDASAADVSLEESTSGPDNLESEPEVKISPAPLPEEFKIPDPHTLENEIEKEKVAEPPPVRTQASESDLWADFFRRYFIIEENSQGQHKYVYFDQIASMRQARPYPGSLSLGTTMFSLNYEDIESALHKVRFKDLDLTKMVDRLVSNYDESAAAIKQAVFDIMYDMQPDYATLIKDKIIVCLTNSPHFAEISSVTSEDVDKVVRLEGIVTQFDNGKQIKITENTWVCENGHDNTTEGSFKPKTCIKEDCGGRITRERTEKQKRTDLCYIRIQQRQDKLREGRVDPMEIDIRFEGTELVQRILSDIYPGQYASIDGVVRLLHLSREDPSTATIEIQGSSFIIMPESVLIEDDPDLDREVKRDVSEDQIVPHFYKLVRSIAPHLEGLELEKMALLAQLAGSDAKEKRGGARFRGDINVLLIGSPSTGKTEMLKFIARVRPRSIYVIGKTASAVGLTAGIEQVEVMRGGHRVSTKRVAFGAYALARDGIVCLDEVEKRDKDDFEDLSHPMDDVQELNVSKAGIYKRISAACASLHAGNPSKNNGVYDRRQPFFSQINFAVWLFSRYDLIFVITDENTDGKRDRLWNYVSDSYAKVRFEKDVPGSIHNKGVPGRSLRTGTPQTRISINSKEDWFPWQYLRREVIYLREKYHPVLKPGTTSWDMMMKFWNRYNQVNLTPALDPEASLDNTAFVPAVDKRKISGLIRVSEAIARLFRSNTVEPEHMDLTINLFKYSIGSLIPEATSGYANPDLMKSQLTRTMKDYASKEFKRGVMERVRDYRQGLFKFTKWLDMMTWENCQDCHGKGKTKFLQSDQEKYYVYRPCTECQGTGGQYRKFTYANISRVPKETGIIPADISRYFNWLLRAGAVKSNGDLTFSVVANLKDKKIFQVDSEIFLDEQGRADLEKYHEEVIINPPKRASDRQAFNEAINDLKRVQYSGEPGDIQE